MFNKDFSKKSEKAVLGVSVKFIKRSIYRLSLIN